MAVMQPLSGDQEGYASNRPDGSAVIPQKAEVPRGISPAAPVAVPLPPAAAAQSPAPAGAPMPADRAPAAVQQHPPEDVDNPFLDTSPTSGAPQPAADDSDNPFAEKAEPPPPAAPTGGTPQMRQVFDSNLKAAEQAKSVPGGTPQGAPSSTGAPAQPQVNEVKPEDPIHDFIHGIEAGWQVSVTGLFKRGQAPDMALSEHPDLAMRIGNQIGSITGDLPFMVAGGLAGGAAGATAGTATLPVVGTIGGGAVGAGGGAFAVPAAMRKILMDHYQKGDITDTRDFVARTMAAAWEGTKGFVTGAATAVTGGAVKPVAGALAATASELGVMTTIGAALEGHLPKAQDFIDGAIVLGGFHAAGAAIPALKGQPPTEEKLQNIYAQTGETPAEIIDRAKKDVELKQDLVAGNAQEPAGAEPTNLEHKTVTEPAAASTEGAPAGEKVLGTKTDLTTKTLQEVDAAPEIPEKFQPPEPATPLEEMSSRARDTQSILSKLGENGENPQKSVLQDIGDAYVNGVDYIYQWERLESSAKERGAAIDLENSGAEMARQARGWSDKVAGFLTSGTEDADGKLNGEGLHPIFEEMKDNGGNMDDYRAYAMAANALEEFDKHGREPWGNFDRQETQRVVDTLAPEYQEYNQRVIDFGNRVLQWAADKGRYSQDQVDQWIKDHEFYSPQSRAFEAGPYDEGASPQRGAPGIRERTGSARDILDPVAQRILNTERVVKNVLINEARSQFVDNMDLGNLIDRTGKWADTAIPPALTEISGEQARGPLKDNQIAVYKDGERTVYEGSKLTIDSLKRLDGDSTALGFVGQALRAVTNMVRLGVVSNPAFGAAHEIRTQFMAGINTQTGLIPFFHPALALMDMIKNTEDFRQFISQGGGSGRYLEGAKGYLTSELARLDDEKAPWQEQAWNVVKKPFLASEAFIRLADTATKFSEYQRTLKQGGTQNEALANARLITPDYANIGLQRSIIRTGVAFIGAHINSLDNLAKVAERDPIGVASKLAVMSFMSAGLWYLNKDDEAIDAVPDWQKNTYWNVNLSRFDPSYKSGQQATILRIPKPWSPGILVASGTEQVLDAYFKYRPQEFQHFAENLTKSVVPEVMPNILQPVLDQYSNKQGFTGRPLVPFYKEKLLPELQYAPYTSETAKAIGRIIGYVPLVKDLGPSGDPLASPAVVENYIMSWGGTMGGWALKMSDAALRGGKTLANTGSVSQAANVATFGTKADPWENTPVLHSFVSRFPSFQDQRIQDFYENREAANQAYNSVKALTKAGDFEAAQRLQAAHPEFQVRLDSIAKGISTARKTYENVQNNPEMGPVEKRQMLDSILFQIGSMAKQGNQIMADFHKTQGQNVVKAQ